MKRPPLITWESISYTFWMFAVSVPIGFLVASLPVWEPASTLPTVIGTTADCDIPRGVDQGHRYYVADCRPDRLSQVGAMQ